MQPVVDHFAKEMDHLSQCVMNNTDPLTPGEEGLKDLTVMMAIYEAANSRKTVRLGAAASGWRLEARGWRLSARAPGAPWPSF